jgi:hypothetical protein
MVSTIFVSIFVFSEESLRGVLSSYHLTETPHALTPLPV